MASIENSKKFTDSPKYLEESKKRLKTIVDKKINTTMIGSLSAFEDHVLNSHFFDSLSKEQKVELNNAFEEARKKILDLGNSAKRNLDEEFKYYTIHWDRYQIVMQVKPRGGR